MLSERPDPATYDPTNKGERLSESGGRFDPPKAGFFCAVASLRFLAAEFVDGGQELAFADEGIGFREQLVLDANSGDAALAELDHGAAPVSAPVQDSVEAPARAF